MGFFQPIPNHTEAYAIDSSGHEYYGIAAKGTPTGGKGWQIWKLEKSTDNWVQLYPVPDSTGHGAVASSQPIFIWSSASSYTYRELGT